MNTLDTLKNISLCFVLALVLTGLSYAIESTFLASFVNNNLILILLTIFSINITTSSVILTKLKEISESHDIDFPKSVQELKLSMQEQVVIVCLAFLFLIFKESQVISNSEIAHKTVNTLLVTLFIFEVYILRDLALSIFVILDSETDKPN